MFFSNGPLDVFADFDDDLDPVILSTDDRFLQEIFEENDDTVFDLCPENTSSFITPTFSDPKYNFSERIIEQYLGQERLFRSMLG